MADQKISYTDSERSVEDAIAALTERFDELARQLRNKAGNAAEAVSDTVKDGRTIARDVGNDVSRQGSNIAGDVRETVTRQWEDGSRGIARQVDEGSRQVREAVRDGYREVRHHGRKGVENVSGRIEDKPIASVLIALGVGFLIGKLM
jgi:ElaB/YqjD/DUF883 family membrane-anchored ribosome-binding protein